jgi:hypothetical protein
MHDCRAGVRAGPARARVTDKHRKEWAGQGSEGMHQALERHADPGDIGPARRAETSARVWVRLPRAVALHCHHRHEEWRLVDLYPAHLRAPRRQGGVMVRYW